MASFSSCYSPLSRDSHDIRILILHSKRHSDHRLQCSLSAHSLDSSPKYEALSYTWGQPDNRDFKIWINGIKFPVRQNLMLVLRILRGDVDRSLWIDALCINKDDDSEKGHQVKMMGNIYRHATSVLSWLGTTDEAELSNEKLDTSSHNPRTRPEPALDLINRIRRTRTHSRTFGPDSSLAFVSKIWCQKHIQNLGLPWKDLENLCNADYWNRTWITQEVCLGQSRCQILHGTEAVAFSGFAEALDKLWLTTQIGPQASKNAVFLCGILQSWAWRLRTVARLHSNLQYDANFSVLFENSIAEASYTRCFDKRDKVYAILGLQNPSVQNVIFPDYSKSLYQVYNDLMSYYVEGDGLFYRSHSDKAVFYKAHPDKARLSHTFQKGLLGPDFSKADYQTMFNGRQSAIHANMPLQFVTLHAQYVGTIVGISNYVGDLLRSAQFYEQNARESLDACAESWNRTMANYWEDDCYTLVFFSESATQTHPSDQLLTQSCNGLTLFVTDIPMTGYHSIGMDVGDTIGIAPQGVALGDELWFHDTGKRVDAPLHHFSIIRERRHVVGRVAFVCGNYSIDSEHGDLPSPLWTMATKQSHIRSPILKSSIQVPMPIFQVLTCPLRYQI